MTTETQQRATRRLVSRLALVVVAMFGFGYLLVPLYDVFCEVTGMNGKTGRLSAEQANSMTADPSRLVTVEFVTSVNSGFPWNFKPMVSRVEVVPGKQMEVMFEVTNRTSDTAIGQAVPSVAPNEAARYFSKTECFCFTEQKLAPGETRQMPVRFIVDPRLPKNIESLTLGYTFFRSTVQVSASPAQNATKPES
ncbi:MAG: cytochrome c oxidase assembly protein [Gammaproteobacteria bacterium]|nr:cytochrome c oxidase assembly protein [Gammaproteobacteria bacterium]